MLAEFRVKNFRSIRSQQCLSLVANKDTAHAESHLINTGSEAIPPLLKSAVIYGPNASGKSNLINALAFMQKIVANSATQIRAGETFKLSSFKLDADSKNQPSEFELTFVEQGIRYQYGFSLMPERVMEEWLWVYETAKPQIWFDRRFDVQKGIEEYKLGTHLKGQRSLWQKSTRANALFLSKAVDLNSECLRPIFLWIVEKLKIFRAEARVMPHFSIDYAQTELGKTELLRFLQAADLSISNMEFENNKKRQHEVVLENGNPPAHTVTEIEVLLPRFVHEAEEGQAAFGLQDESTGTQKFFGLAGPILDILKNGYVLVVDELDSSMHTHMMCFLIRQFYSQNNSKGAQLIFSTHDTALLANDLGLFRRDQIWFVEKDRAQATILRPLSDFKPRKAEAFDRGYLGGRYGALPFMTDFNLGNGSTKNSNG